jgi:2-polyprenyl-3-methyl-5-hydroxy-6-metoxy-1,4-benzoquinol methylase
VIEKLRMEPKRRLPLNSDSFDVVLFLEVLEHIIDDPKHVFSEINRILKAGGYLFMTTPNIAQLFNRLMLLFGKQPQHFISSLRYGYKSARGHFREWTADELINLLKSSFRIEKCTYVDSLGTEGLVRERKLLRAPYYPYKFLCAIKPSFRSTIVMVCRK